jgi:tetratricopeptide (TPR) repeat protein
VLDAFVRGNLPWGTRMGIEGHIDTCPDCAEVVSEMARLFGSSQWVDGSMHTPPDGPVAPVTLEAPPDGLTVGRYRLGQQLGAGAMGMVFEAHDPQLHRRVAIKLLHPGVSDGPDGARLLREARSMAQLAHPNVVTVHDAGRAGSQVFVAMELVDGMTLGTWLAEAKRERDAILGVFAQAGRGLDAAHRVGIVHRDFKPENVMLGTDGRARVADFGLARPSVAWAAGQPEPAQAVRTTMTIDGLTQQGAVVGTPAYMAPEQWNGTLADARSDQFAFCVALYEALAGERPFEGKTLPALANAVTQGRLRPMARSIPAWLRRALSRGLSVDPRARYPSMTALLRVLERDRGFGRRTAAVVGAMGIGAVATVGVLRWMAEETQAPPPAQPLPAVVAAPDEAPPDVPAPVLVDTACEARVETVDGAWNGPRRDAYVAVLRRAEHGDAVETRTLPWMDRWASRYAELARPLCEPTKPRLAGDRARCLASARVSFDALVAEAGQQTASGIERAASSAAYRLPDVGACGREPFLMALSPPPPETLNGQVKLIAEDVAAGRALMWLGAFVKAPPIIEAAVGQARAAGHAPLLADALLAQGELAAQRRDVGAAVAALQEAVLVAETCDATWVRGMAATHLLALQGGQQRNASAVARWRRVTGSFVERLGDPVVTAEVMRAEAEVLFAHLELEQAAELLGKTLDVHEELHGKTHPKVADVLRLQAEVALALGEHDDAQRDAERALEVFETTVGPLDLDTLGAVRLVARVALAQGRFDDAEALATRSVDALALFSTLRHDIDRGDALLVQGDVARARGDVAAARDAYERAKTYHYQGRWRAYPLLRLSELDLSQGKTKDAITSAREAVAILDDSLDASDVRRTDAIRGLAKAQLAHGAVSSARQNLEDVRTLIDAQVGFGPLQSRSAIELADLELADGRVEEALALLDDAHVAWTGAYGLRHPKVIDRVLTRADLAWGLKQRDYAKRLYGSVLEGLEVHRGADDPAVVRARRRAK